MSKGCIMRWREGVLVYHEEKGKVLVNKHYVPKTNAFNVISDDLGSKGVVNPADGKKYDSKSAYYKAVKDKGYEIVGNEKLGASKPNVPDIDWKRAVAETLQQKGY
jgi:hypothetical protein